MSTNSGNLTNASTTIAAGGASQPVLAAAQRQYLLVHNPTNEAEPLLVNFGAAATAANAVHLAPGGSMVFETSLVPGQALHLLAATTGHRCIVWWA